MFGSHKVKTTFRPLTTRQGHFGVIQGHFQYQVLNINFDLVNDITIIIISLIYFQYFRIVHDSGMYLNVHECSRTSFESSSRDHV